MRVGQTTKWLVKSNGRILGPYSDRQIFDLLKDKVVVPLDEVSKPFDRWNYIRDEPIFARIVEELRQRNLRGMFDDSTTRGEESTNITNTTPATLQNDELTAEISQTTLNDVNNVQDVFFQSIDEKPSRASAHVNKNVFTYEGDKSVNAQSHTAARWAWMATTVVILVTVGFVVFQRFVAQPIQTKSIIGESTSAGIEALESGEYAAALEYFDKAFNLDQDDTSIYLYLGVLKTQVGEQPFQGRKLLEKLKGHEEKDLKRVWSGIGLSYLKEGDFKLAEDSFNKSLDIDPLFTPAVINLGATAMYQEDWNKASNHLLLAVKDGSGDGAEYIMLTEVMRKLYDKDKEKRYLTESQKYLNEFLLKSQNYLLESKIGLLYIDVLLGEKSRIYQDIDKILDLDFDLTENIRQNIFIHRSKADWGLVSQWCLKLTSDLDPTARVIAFEALCLIKAGDVVEANRKINDALAQAPKDPLVQSTAAYIFDKMNMSAHVPVAIQKALDNNADNTYTQPLRLKAQHCQPDSDVDCARKYWNLVYEKNKNSLDAIAQLSKIYFRENNLPEAKKYLLRGLNISSSYKPIFNLNILISRSEDKTKARGL